MCDIAKFELPLWKYGIMDRIGSKHAKGNQPHIFNTLVLIRSVGTRVWHSTNTRY